MSNSIEIRPLRQDDLVDIVRLHNAGGFGPVTGGQALTALDLQTFLSEKGTYLFLVAEDQEEQAIVGTLGLFLVSEQRVARPGEVYASSFFIQSDYRNGLLPSRLFMQALWSLVQDGYTTISATVSPANAVALALYKRIGLYRLQASKPDYDGQIELRGYQPLIMRAIQCLYPSDSPEMPHSDSPWRFMAPTRTLRTNDVDSECWHGLEVVTYEVHAEQLHFFFRIDVESDGLVELRANAVHFSIYPEPDARVMTGDRGSLVCELTNSAPEPRMYGVSLSDEAVLVPRMFQSQETWRQEVPFSFAHEGFHILDCALSMGRQIQDFHVGVVASERVSYMRVRPLQRLEPEKPVWISVRFTNETDQVLRGVLKILTPTFTHVLVSPKHIVLPARGATELTLYSEAISAGLHPIKVGVQTANGEQWLASPLIQPVLTTQQEVVYQENNDYVLETVDQRVSLDKETGFMRVWDKSSERLMLYEAWPTVGPPLPGGLKRDAKRPITRLPAPENVLILAETLEDGSALHRRLHLLNSGRLEIAHTWEPTVSSTTSYEMLKTLGECAFRQDVLTVPLLAGWRTQAVVYGGYPYRLHEYEAIPSTDLPQQCGAYAENWAAFEEDGLTVGALWQDAEKLCFGGHWMPSLYFTLPEGMQTTSLANYAYVIGRGGAEYVAEHWRQFSSRKESSGAEASDGVSRTQARGVERSTSLVLRLNELAFSPVSVERGEGVHSISSKQNSFENGTLGLRLAPGESGVVTALTYKGVNILQMAGQRPKAFGDNSVWLGGIHPTLVQEPPRLLGGLLCDPDNLMSWQSEEVTQKVPDWQGITLTHDTLQVRYELHSWRPMLRLAVEYSNPGPVTQTFYVLFHLFLRSMQHRVPKKVHYERGGTHYCLSEEGKTRRVYAKDWSIITSGKDVSLGVWAEPETQLEIATYEWARDGFQHILMLPFQVAPGETKRAHCHLLVTPALTQLLSSAGDTAYNSSERSIQEQISGVLV